MALISCPECGRQVSNRAESCPDCGYPVGQMVSETQKLPETSKKNRLKKPFILLGAVAVVIALVLLCGGDQCEASGCTNTQMSGGDYCATHTCAKSECYSYKAAGNIYCRTHDAVSTGTVSVAESASQVLKFSNIKIEHNSSYTVCTGKVTNNGKKTYSFVEIKGSFKNSSGKVLDTDWTYAVGSEGLAPGESASFRLSVSKDRSIEKCDISLLDYDT